MPEQREFTAKSHTFHLGSYKFTKIRWEPLSENGHAKAQN